MAEPKLDKDTQIYIVQQLAMYEKPVSIRDAVKQIYGYEISLPAIMNYQITSPKFPDKWRDLFESTRKKFIENVGDIPIAQKTYRLKKLQNIFDRQEEAKMQNPVEMRNTLEHAAKETGGMFTNQRVLTGKDGGAISIDVGSKTELIEAEAQKLAKQNGTTIEEEKKILVKLLAQNND